MTASEDGGDGASESADAKPALGRRLRSLREAAGISRGALAASVGVDVTAVAAWERGAYLPRSERRRALAEVLRIDPADLLDGNGHDAGVQEGRAQLIDTHVDLPDMLASSLAECRRLRALRAAAPYSTAAYIQHDFRAEIGRRITEGSLKLERIEVFYQLDRLKEQLSNAFRYDGCDYRVRGYASRGEILPAIGGYLFDDAELYLGGYWAKVPPGDEPSLHLRGEPYRTFFNAYWAEIWRRGLHLNLRGAHDLSRYREIALQLGLPEGDWPTFVDEARALEIGDGAPPLP